MKVRFLFILLGPKNPEIDYVELGRCMGTLMTNRVSSNLCFIQHRSAKKNVFIDKQSLMRKISNLNSDLKGVPYKSIQSTRPTGTCRLHNNVHQQELVRCHTARRIRYRSVAAHRRMDAKAFEEEKETRHSVPTPSSEHYKSTRDAKCQVNVGKRQQGIRS